MLEEIIKLAQNKCTGLFMHESHPLKPDFGINREYSNELFYLCNPCRNFSKLRSLFLPKTLRKIYSESLNSPESTIPSDTLYIFHYSINKKRFNKNVKTLYILKRYLCNTSKHLKSSMTKPDQFLKLFYNSYGKNPSCIFMNIWGYGMILGSEKNNRTIVKFLKTHQTKEILEFFKGVMGESYQFLNADEKIKNAKIFDLVYHFGDV